jgi:hypothetical protein
MPKRRMVNFTALSPGLQQVPSQQLSPFAPKLSGFLEAFPMQ